MISLINKYRLILVVFFLFYSITLVAQQPITMPRVSPYAEVLQRIGFSDVKLTFHRPGVKERQIWGGLVPYNEIWRAGANENTTFSITDDAKINGRRLPAGSYGFHAIPGEEEWTLIFNTVDHAWGSFFYDESLDELRIKVKPEQNEFNEWLNYEIDIKSSNAVTVSLVWENLRVSFDVEFDLYSIIVDNFKKQLRSLPGFNPAAFAQAANYLVKNNVYLDQAEEWIDKALARARSMNNLLIKAAIYDLRGNKNEYERLTTEAYDAATEVELNTFGYQLMSQGEVEKAISVFEINIKKFPDSWNVYDSLAEAYAFKGEIEKAKKYYNKTLEMAPEDQKERIKDILESL
ncbi:MAG: DUF2911 domain-containing protein [Melioribacteraceae bacterium]|nr:DUF2911 domain-containing protein [Melioribacteraceae bacterium]MCF8353025.1 DUF2911 domain-containing protein [Melioribacteraceae bacterium]MCF8392916.1 DUF2911 domain-containing protein [Melioribacteraceae bacterium]MCF8417790.1 DUF2911 domain-containing protein [Melioribacteraceae bacterium]